MEGIQQLKPNSDNLTGINNNNINISLIEKAQMSKERFASLGKEGNAVLGFRGMGVLVSGLAPSSPWGLGGGRVAVTPGAGLLGDPADPLGLSREKSNKSRTNSAGRVGSNFVKGTKWNL